MRKLSAIFAIGCLFFLMAGYHLVYYVRLAEAKREMRKEILSAKPGVLSTFVFTNDEMDALSWDGTNEFRYKGEMFDVLRMETSNGRTLIWCIADKNETALLQQYQHSQKQSSGSSSFLLLKLLSSQYLPCAVALLPVLEPTAQRRCAFFQHHFPESNNKVITPPPKVC